MNKEQFINYLKKIDINIKENQINQLDMYYNLLITENQKINLTGITEYNLVYLKHFYDSLTLNKIIKLDNQTLCDIGTGAGFPGIVLKIVFPNLKVTLIEPLNKRCNFLKLVIDTLELKDITIINERAEDYGKKVRETHDIVTSRAVANLKELIEYSIPLLKVNGHFIPMKSNIDKELNNIETSLSKLKSKIIKIEKFKLPIEESERTLLDIIKLEPTKNIYPRNYSQIKKNPL